jgi:hypothetical protein
MMPENIGHHRTTAKRVAQDRRGGLRLGNLATSIPLPLGLPRQASSEASSVVCRRPQRYDGVLYGLHSRGIQIELNNM